MFFHRSAHLSSTLLVPLVALLASSASADDRRPAGELDALQLRNASLQQIALRTLDDTLFVEVRLGDTTVQIELTPESIRSSSFQIQIQEAGGSLRSMPAPAISTMHGFVVGDPASEVRASFRGGNLRAVIRTASEVWALQPRDRSTVGGDHWVYLRDDIDPVETLCATETPLTPTPTPMGPTPTAAGETYIAEIAIDVDYEFYLLHGQDLAATIADVENIIFQLAPAYETLGIIHEITTVIVRTDPNDPYTSTSPNTLLEQFRSTWNSDPELSIERDVAHLFTGKNLDGNIIGIASIEAVCDLPNAYGLSQSLYSNNLLLRIALTAHELGHNWSANHCDGMNGCKIMCSIIASCESLSIFKFGPHASSSIFEHRESIGCLTPDGGGLSLPFVEPFANLEIDSDRWSSWNLVEITDAAGNEPSAPYSLRLQGHPSQESTITTRIIDLSEAIDPIMAVSFKSVGVGPTDSLSVEYLQSNQSWTGFQFPAAPTPSQTFNTLALPFFGDPIHEGFRLRVRISNGVSGYWYVDDIMILEAAGNRSIFLRGDANNDQVLELTDAVLMLEYLFLGQNPPLCDDAIDVNDDGRLDLGDPVGMLSFLFLGDAPPAPPFPFVGPDFTEDSLSCPAAY